ncbi:hypothetical protein CL644_02255 [bacterium]|nr:hypothetical protein [bacterium]
MNTHDLVYVVHKRVGQTPLQAIEASRIERTIAEGIPMAYAGRLDPMAEGKLLVLTGKKCKEIKKYWDLDKEYKISVVLGLSSDSHDVLGRLSYSANPLKAIDADTIKKTVQNFKGAYSWPYPVLSSKPVKGKPLFQWFLEDRLGEIEIPESKGTIFNIELANIRTATPKELKKRTLEKIHALAIVTDESKRLGRDFRRHEVIDSWNTWYKTDAQPLQVLDITCIASSGTCMRTLAYEIGKKLGTSALALEIHRTEVGKYAQFGPFKFWRKKY